MSLQELVAHYLSSNYPSVLQSFIDAAGIPPPDPSNVPQPDLRTLVENYLSQQLADSLNTLTTDTKEVDSLASILQRSLPPTAQLHNVVRSIDGTSAANLLTVQVARLPRREFDTTTAQYKAWHVKTIITTSVDKTIKLLNYDTGDVDILLQPHAATVLSLAVHPRHSRYILSGSMDGTTILSDIVSQQALQTFHSGKFVVRVAFSEDGQYMATASYDREVVIYRVSIPSSEAADTDTTDDPHLASDPSLRYSEYLRVSTESNPEALLFASKWLMYTLRNSHLLFYINLETKEAVQKNFNPHPLDTHISFAVLNLALHPSGKIVACQTGDRGAERVLLYGIDPSETERLACLWTGQDADDFVLPRLSWLPDGTGLITTSPNGYLRLLSISGEVRSRIKVHGEERGSSEVIRDCCVVQDEDGWEVVSVGYDRRIRISR